MTDDMNPVTAPGRTVYRVDRQKKRALLKHLIAENTWSRCMVYVRTKYAVARLGKQLEQDGFNVVLVHNSMGKVRRNDAVQAFTNGDANVLVSSDMATRGMQLPESIDCVANLDLPTEPCLEQRETHIASAQYKLFLLSDDEEKALNESPLFNVADYQFEVVAGFGPNPEAGQKTKPEKEPEADKPVVEKASRRGRRNPANRKQTTSRQNAKNQPKRRPSASRAALDENGDVNGNTLVSDNANRSAVDLACDGTGLPKKRTNSRLKKRPRSGGQKLNRRQVPGTPSSQ